MPAFVTVATRVKYNGVLSLQIDTESEGGFGFNTEYIYTYLGGDGRRRNAVWPASPDSDRNITSHMISAVNLLRSWCQADSYAYIQHPTTDTDRCPPPPPPWEPISHTLTTSWSNWQHCLLRPKLKLQESGPFTTAEASLKDELEKIVLPLRYLNFSQVKRYGLLSECLLSYEGVGVGGWGCID